MGNSRVIVQAEAATASVGESRLFEDVTFRCESGQWLLLCGASGSGKSSLLRAINGLCVPTRGWIETLGTRIPGRRPAEARAAWRRSGTVLQELGLFESRSARANIDLGLRAGKVPATERPQRIAEVVAHLELDGLEERFPCELSGGQRQRVALARAIAARPALLILDEPTSALDNKTADLTFSALADLRSLGTAILMASHRLAECVGVCDRIIEMRDGRVVKDETCAKTKAQCTDTPPLATWQSQQERRVAV